jgi:hypothetical protein
MKSLCLVLKQFQVEKLLEIDKLDIVPDDIFGVIAEYVGFDENLIDEKSLFEQIRTDDIIKNFSFPKRDSFWNYKSRVARMVIFSGDIVLVRRFFLMYYKSFIDPRNHFQLSQAAEKELIGFVKKIDRKYRNLEYFVEICRIWKGHTILAYHSDIESKITRIIRHLR